MIYKAYSFDTIYHLKDFLNNNKIKPTNIIGIYREHRYQDLGVFDLLYVEQTERTVKRNETDN